MVGLMNMRNISLTVLLVNFVFNVFSFKLFNSVSAATLKDFVVYELQPGMRVNGSNQRLEIFCYAGVPKHFLHIFQTAKLHINLDPSKFDHYEGPTPDMVWKAYEEARLAWTFDPLSWKRNDFTLNPFNTSCIGVISTQKYFASLIIIRMDQMKLAMFLSGLVMFCLAPRLSRNALFFYLCGIIVGISTSLLLLFYLVHKMLPKSRLLYGLALGCSTLGIFVFHSLWQYVHSIIFEYSNQVLTYILVTGLVSFVMCYRMGPPTDPRSRNIIKWTIQALSLALIFYSSFFKELVSAIMTLTAVLHYFPPGLSEKAISYWKYSANTSLAATASTHVYNEQKITKEEAVPPKVKLLTEEEYLQQGVEETKKALDELKGYCSSPDCNTWKTIRKIKHPDRFIEFMNDSSHVSSEEILAYEMDLRHTSNDLFTDDEDSSDDEQVSPIFSKK